MSKEVIFKIIEGSLTGEEFAFEDDGLCLIGRSADCALQIPKAKDMRISRRHCLLILNPPNVRIRDLGSRNGTRVNDEYLDSATLSEEPEKMTPVDKILKDGDVVSIGETVFIVEIPSAKSVPPEEVSTKIIPAQTAPLKPGVFPAPRTKVIKLSKPNPTQPGTIIPKSQPMAAGFFQAPTSSPTLTSSRTIAMTEAISREELAISQKAYLDEKAAEKNIAATQEATAFTTSLGSVPSGPLAPPPKKMVAKIVQKPHATTAAGPLAPPPPPPPEAPKKSPILLGKKKGTSATTASEGNPKVLKAKIVSAPAAGLTQKQADLRARTEVMSIAELESIEDVPEVSTSKITAPKPKRVTKFKIKGPK